MIEGFPGWRKIAHRDVISDEPYCAPNVLSLAGEERIPRSVEFFHRFFGRFSSITCRDFEYKRLWIKQTGRWIVIQLAGSLAQEENDA
jgi:hypothetical protein